MDLSPSWRPRTTATSFFFFLQSWRHVQSADSSGSTSASKELRSASPLPGGATYARYSSCGVNSAGRNAYRSLLMQNFTKRCKGTPPTPETCSTVGRSHGNNLPSFGTASAETGLRFPSQHRQVGYVLGVDGAGQIACITAQEPQFWENFGGERSIPEDSDSRCFRNDNSNRGANFRDRRGSHMTSSQSQGHFQFRGSCIEISARPHPREGDETKKPTSQA